MPLNIAKNYSDQSKINVSHFPNVKIKDLIQMPASKSRRKTQNELLSNLSPDLYAELEPFMQKVSFYRGQIIYEVGSRINYVYFPDNFIASRLAITEDGSMIEVGMIGHEGMLGVRSVMGDNIAESVTLAEMDGTAVRISAETFRKFFNRSKELQNTILRFYEKFLLQVSQRAVCRCRHTIFKQLCNWLLQFQERASTFELSLTQETIAQRLGARRSGVTVALNELEAKGIISCSRGSISILNHTALAREACECHVMLESEQNLDFFVKNVH